MTTVKMKFLLGYTMKILYSGQEGTFSGENFFFFFFLREEGVGGYNGQDFSWWGRDE